MAILMEQEVLSEALGRRNKAASVASDETENLFMDIRPLTILETQLRLAAVHPASCSLVANSS